MKKSLLVIIFFLTGVPLFSQRRTENLIIITLDGFRWQELFRGMDTVLLNDSNFTRNAEELKKKFGAPTEEERREKLFPFIWKTIAREGQLYGNRKYGNKVDNLNPYWFSYPGYNEIFTGYPDTAVNSNDKVYNRNENVLEFINKQAGFRNRVAAFSSWDVFPYIFNAPRSKLFVNADGDTLAFDRPVLNVLNDMQFLTTRPLGVRPDLITYFAAREYLKEYKPRVLYIAFDETDDFAHAGLYDQYLGAASAEDAMIADLWKLVQSIPQYSNKTSLLITVDHGRGDAVKKDWRHHGSKTPDSHEIWIAALGPDSKALGEIKEPMQLYQAQVAGTIAALLGFDFKPAHPVKTPLQAIYSALPNSSQ